MEEDQLLLENQVCFPIYSVSRLITKAYQPHLDKMGITYPQYLVLMVLWEKDKLPVNSISEQLMLNTNTLSPLLKRMEKMELLERRRSPQDERSVIVELTKKGLELKNMAKPIPYPNPAHDKININNTMNFEVVTFFNVNGQLIKTVALTAGQNQIDLDLPQGLYMLQFRNNNQRMTKKLMVK